MRSAGNNLPLAGATVTFSPTGATTTTRSDGRYSQDLPVGLHSAAFTAPGFVGAAVPVVNVLAGQTTAVGDVVLARTPATLSASVAGERWQAGFDAAVVLTASATGAPAGAVTYRWTQLSGPEIPPAELAGSTTATLSFTTRSVAAVEAAGLVVLPSRFAIVGITAVDADNLTYVFEVSAVTTLASATARASVQTLPTHSGLSNVAIGVKTLLTAPAGQGSYLWTCSAGGPPCDPDVFTGATTRNPTFQPNGGGLYTIAETSQPAPLTVQAATYIGVTNVVGRVTCQSCHDGVINASDGRVLTPKAPTDGTAWGATRHASFFQRGIDGQLGPYDKSCIVCHTTGFNPEASNGGFDDVAAELGWAFPTPAPGTWAAMPPRLQSLSNIACENCHGPGSEHAAQQTFATIGKSFAATDCNQCHAGPTYGVQGRQWLKSRHSRFVTGAVPQPGDPALQPGCSTCHTAQGFVTLMRTGAFAVTAPTADTAEPQTCIGCHDPHGEGLMSDGFTSTPHLLRMFGAVTLLPGYGAHGAGAGALCMNCHNAIAAFDPVGQPAPHAGTQADVLLGKGAATFGEGGYPTSSHLGVPNTCVGCHMAPVPAPDADTGGHTFNMRSFADATPNANACTSCHSFDPILDPLLNEFNRLAYGDYDGNGVVDGIQTEVDRLQVLFAATLADAAATLFPVETGFVAGGPTPVVVSAQGTMRLMKVYDGSDQSCDPASAPAGGWPERCFAFAAGAIPTGTAAEQAFLGAAWNYLLVSSDKSFGVHNTAYAVSVLQRSYRKLTGSDVPGATLR